MSLKANTFEFEKGNWTIFPGLCKGCGLCMEKCPKKSLKWSEVLGVYGTPAVESTDACNACGICQMFCPDCAIVVEKKKKN